MSKDAMLNDIRNNPNIWFQYFCCNNPQGMDKNQVVNALQQTFDADQTSLRGYVDVVWPIIDPDLSGRITVSEFLRPNGLREMILAQFMAKSQSQSQSQNSSGTSPTQPVNVSCGHCRQLFNIGPQAQRSVIVICPFCHNQNQINVPVPPTPPVSYSNPPPTTYQPPSNFQPSSLYQPQPPANTAFLPPSAPVYNPPSHPVYQAPVSTIQPPLVYQPINVATPNYLPQQHQWNSPLPSAPPRPGRKKALLVGINYRGTRCQLQGCISDVDNIKQLLIQTYGWPLSDIRCLVDDGSTAPPTRANILHDLQWLASAAQPGDVLFFHFSGHGAQQPDPHGFEEDGMNETILPVDHKSAGMITDDEMSGIIVRPLPSGCKLIAVMDCCHSGTGLDLPYELRNGSWKEETNPFLSAADVCMFSGCMDEGTSSDVSAAYCRPGGAMTTAFCQALRTNPSPSYFDLMRELHREMSRGGYAQLPNLTTSQRFDPNRRFLPDDIMPNANTTLGRIFRRKFPPKPRKTDPMMAEMLGAAALGVGALVMLDMLL